MVTDGEVIEAVLRGEVDRYAELVSRYQLAAWKLAFGFVGNFEDAKELSQNGFVKAFRHLRTFRRQAKFSTWLYRIIVNECKDFLRRKIQDPLRAFVAVDPDPEGDNPGLFEVEDPGRGPSDLLADRELAQHLSRAIQGLPMKQRTAFLLHHVQGLSLEEVSQAMECRTGTVKAHVFRAVEHLRRVLAPYVTEEVRT